MNDLSTKNRTETKAISILGCGWLGFPLAEKLIEQGFSVKGSTTSQEKIPTFLLTGITPFLIQLNEKKLTGEITPFLAHSPLLIIAIPPGLRKEPKENFVQKITLLLPYLEKSSIKNLIFISSTSVYNDDENFPKITAESTLNGTSEAAKQLISVEQLLQKNKNFKTTILRFGGLIGEDRHPITFLSGRANIKNPKAPINLIHRTDCIKIIIEIIKQEAWSETFNAAFPSHPSKEKYYTEKAEKRQLPMPLFEEDVVSKGKIINAEKLKNHLGFTFTQEI